MKILNLYAGIGGNRRLWGDEHEVTAVELDHTTADVYRHFWPNDMVIEADAHEYLLHHYSEFDFIWSSPPCPTHSRLNTALHAQGHSRYPDMSLWQEIIFLRHFAKGRKWVVENVIPYYACLMTPRAEIERHFFWANFHITSTSIPDIGLRIGGNHPNESEEMEQLLGFKLPDFGLTQKQRRLMLRDITRPEIGAHILKAAMRETKQESLL